MRLGSDWTEERKKVTEQTVVHKGYDKGLNQERLWGEVICGDSFGLGAAAEVEK